MQFINVVQDFNHMHQKLLLCNLVSMARCLIEYHLVNKSVTIDGTASKWVQVNVSGYCVGSLTLSYFLIQLYVGEI